MKSILAVAVAAVATTLIGAPVLAQTSVSIGINQPGVYGHVRIGDVPRPALVRPEPVIVVPPRVVVERRPVYLYVPTAHEQNWRRYCGRYHACGQPVYFVRDDWVRERYVHEHPGWDRGRHRGWEHDRGHGKGHDRKQDTRNRHGRD